MTWNILHKKTALELSLSCILERFGQESNLGFKWRAAKKQGDLSKIMKPKRKAQSWRSENSVVIGPSHTIWKSEERQS